METGMAMRGKLGDLEINQEGYDGIRSSWN